MTAYCADGESVTPHGLQWALNQAVPGTPLVINLDRANCSLLLATPLTLGANLDITINGQGLVLYSSSESGTSLIQFQDSPGNATSLTLKHVTLRDAEYGVLENPTGLPSSLAGTVNLIGGSLNDIYCGVCANAASLNHTTVSGDYYGAYTAGNATATNSTFQDNDYGLYVYGTATVSGSTFNENPNGYGIYATTANLSNSTFDDNYVAVTADWATITSSTFTNNEYALYNYFTDLSDSTVTNNQYAVWAYADASGVGNAAVTDSTLTDNQYAVIALINGPFSGTAEVGGSWLSDNGYGIYGGAYPSATVTSSVTSGKSAEPPGKPGPSNNPSAASAGGVSPADDLVVPETVSLTDSQIVNSSYEGISTIENATVTNSTITGSGQDGIDADVANVTNSTITGSSGNGVTAGDLTATFDTIVANGTGGISFGTARLTADILSGNQGPACSSSSLTDNGGNLSTDDSCGFTVDTSANGVDGNGLQLGPLADNGGPLAGAPGSQQTVQTFSLGFGSIAIDRLGLNEIGQCIGADEDAITYAGSNMVVTTDERGVTRPQGAGCDSGAFEANVLAAPASGFTTVVHQGYYALIRIEALDANGRDISSRTLPVNSVELYSPNGQEIPYNYPFALGRIGGQSGYQLAINTRNFAPGEWILVVRIGGAFPTTTTVSFTVE
ncbi:MAG TPA: choice-of-anchor Q domain-containing protein [Thermomicrobiaceae bacterium]|nr:choice-of-anchor Q domain-containing protein [Thermomicrobiaceae bacterium]